jgi:predicted nucleic acid-binding protein
VTVAVDTSVAVPLLVRSHHDHTTVVRWWNGQEVTLRLGIAGGAVYDALVALAAKEHGAALATRDARARGTYDAVGVMVIVVT